MFAGRRRGQKWRTPWILFWPLQSRKKSVGMNVINSSLTLGFCFDLFIYYYSSFSTCCNYKKFCSPVVHARFGSPHRHHEELDAVTSWKVCRFINDNDYTYLWELYVLTRFIVKRKRKNLRKKSKMWAVGGRGVPFEVVRFVHPHCPHSCHSSVCYLFYYYDFFKVIKWDMVFTQDVEEGNKKKIYIYTHIYGHTYSNS